MKRRFPAGPNDGPDSKSSPGDVDRAAYPPDGARRSIRDALEPRPHERFTRNWVKALVCRLTTCLLSSRLPIWRFPPTGTSDSSMQGRRTDRCQTLPNGGLPTQAGFRCLWTKNGPVEHSSTSPFPTSTSTFGSFESAGWRLARSRTPPRACASRPSKTPMATRSPSSAGFESSTNARPHYRRTGRSLDAVDTRLRGQGAD